MSNANDELERLRGQLAEATQEIFELREQNETKEFEMWHEADQRATAAETALREAREEMCGLKQRLASLSFHWRKDDFNGLNFSTKREAAAQLEAALNPGADNE